MWVSGVSLEHFEEGETERLRSPAQQLPECSDAGKLSEGVK